MTIIFAVDNKVAVVVALAVVVDLIEVLATAVAVWVDDKEVIVVVVVVGVVVTIVLSSVITSLARMLLQLL